MDRAAVVAAAVLFGILLALPLRAELKLAGSGKTAYTIVVPKGASRIEHLAAADLAEYLKKATGATFRIAGSAAPPRIVIGERAPSDKRPLVPRERRVRSEGNDLYLYGADPRGNAFAVYDFLDDLVGCRWFSLWGDEYVPKKPTLVFDKVEFARIPSFDAYEAGYYVEPLMRHPGVRNFVRRNRFYLQTHNPAPPTPPRTIFSTTADMDSPPTCRPAD